MRTQAEKGEAFRAMHERADAFIIPNPWDIGTARLLAQLGFEALATTSAGYAFSVGRPDSTVSREETLAHVAAIVSATDLPVSADLENGFGDSPEAAAETITLAAAAGLAGGSIEDLPIRSRGAAGSASGSATDAGASVGAGAATSAGTGAGTAARVYEIAHATDRIRAAAEVVRNLPFRFTLTARAENFIAGNPDLKDTIARLQAYQEAGADVLYAPGLTSRDDIATVVRAVDRPVNVLMGLQGAQFSVAELSALGVKRISVGSALSRAALGAFLRAAREMRTDGTFTFANDAISYRDITTMFESMR
jgi:2-methylisocitrate lyase-like PEP mutase family enzyme